MLENIKAVIFDLDGSLVDSMWLWYQIDVEYLGRFGLEVPKGLQHDIEGFSFSETAVYFKERFQIPDDLDTIKRTWNEMAWKKYRYEVPLKPGADRLLAYCREHDIKLGIATSNSRELVSMLMEVYGLSDAFSCIMTGCDVGKGKPAPDIYLAVAKALDVSCENCLVFEDIIPGIMAGKAAGMKVCAVEDAYSLDQKDAKSKMADYYIKDFHEIMDCMKQS